MQDLDKYFAVRKPGDFKTSPDSEVYFLPEYMHLSNKYATEYRAAVLFGSELVKDPLDRSKSRRFFQSDASKAELPTTFKLVPSQFLHRARMTPPEKPQATASAFSQWIYSLYGSAYGNDEDRERGKAVEQVIFDRRRSAACSIDNNFLHKIGSSWELVHNGLHLNKAEQVNYFKINHLHVNGEPLRASPDLIYRNSNSSEIIIVEIKHSRLPITTNLWPNVWAQLWCYSQLEIVRSAKKLTVVGEVWGEKWTRGRGQGRTRTEGYPLLCLRASVRRNPRAPAYDRFFRKLFDIYRGEC